MVVSKNGPLSLLRLRRKGALQHPLLLQVSLRSEATRNTSSSQETRDDCSAFNFTDACQPDGLLDHNSLRTTHPLILSELVTSGGVTALVIASGSDLGRHLSVHEQEQPKAWVENDDLTALWSACRAWTANALAFHSVLTPGMSVAQHRLRMAVERVMLSLTPFSYSTLK